MRMKAPAIGMAVAFATTAPAGIATAQGLRAENVTEIGVSLDVRHDSNVARSALQRAEERGLARADQRATPSIDFVLARPLGRNTIALSGSAGYDFYRRNKRLNRERLALGLDSTVVGGPLIFDLGANLSRSQTDPADLTPLLVPGTASVRNTQTVQSYNAQVRLNRGIAGFSPTASFSRSTGDNSNFRRELSNYRSTQYGGGLAYESPALGYWDLQYLRSDTDYPDRPETIGNTGFVTDSVRLTGKRDLGAVLVASGSIAWITLTPDADRVGVQKFNSVGYSLSLTAVPTPDIQLTGAFNRDVSPSLGTDALYQIGNDYSVTGTYQLGRDLGFSLRGSISDRHYEGAGQFFALALTDSVQRSVTGTVSLAQSRPLSAAVDVGYAQRDANGTFFDYDSFFVAIRTSFRLGR